MTVFLFNKTARSSAIELRAVLFYKYTKFFWELQARILSERDVMLSPVEAWRAGLCALPFDGALGDTRPLQSNLQLPLPLQGQGALLGDQIIQLIQAWGEHNFDATVFGTGLVGWGLIDRLELAFAGSC